VEILNKDELAKIATETPYQSDHGLLLAALCTRYPQSEFVFVGTWGEWTSGINGLLDANGNIVSDDFQKWVTAEYEAAGQSALRVWERYKDAGMIITEWQGTTVYIAVPYAGDPDAYIHVEIEAKHEITYRYAFESDPWSVPKSLYNLVSPMSGAPAEKEINPWRYEIKKVVDIRRYVREMVAEHYAERQACLPEMTRKDIRIITVMTGLSNSDGRFESHQQTQDFPFLEMYPDWLTWEHPCARLMRDWSESSAGQTGYRFCDHWFLQVNDYTDEAGKRYMAAIPQWSDKDGGCELPKIYPDSNDSPLLVMDSLFRFDNHAGYPFAWFFYMLHGNRVGHTAGAVIAQGIKDCVIRLPERDEKVLLRWHERGYGF